MHKAYNFLILILIIVFLLFFGLIISCSKKDGEEKIKSDPYIEKYNLVFETSDGEKGAEAFFDDNNLIIHNIFDEDLTNLYIIVDVWKNGNSDASYVVHDIELFQKNAVLILNTWTKIGREGPPTENEKLPDEEYIVRRIEIDCDEGLFEARKIE